MSLISDAKETDGSLTLSDRKVSVKAEDPGPSHSKKVCSFQVRPKPRVSQKVINNDPSKSWFGVMRAMFKCKFWRD